METIRTRNEIAALIQQKEAEVLRLNDEMLELQREGIMLSDSKQRFSEDVEVMEYRDSRKKKTISLLIGRVHWKQKFMDGDTGVPIWIERSRIVRVNKNWDFACPLQLNGEYVP